MNRILMASGAALAALLLSACGGDSSTATTGSSEPPATSAAGGTEEQTVTISDFTFDPSELTISGPTTIEVVNEDDVQHSFTLDDDSASQNVQGGANATVDIDPAASVGFHCEFHPDMTGSITVG